MLTDQNFHIFCIQEEQSAGAGKPLEKEGGRRRTNQSQKMLTTKKGPGNDCRAFTDYARTVPYIFEAGYLDHFCLKDF